MGSPSGTALLVMACSAALRLKPGWAWKSRAARPVTWGAAMEVPSFSAYPPPGTLERTLVPGAETSGLVSPQGEGPRLEKEAITSSVSVAPTAKDSAKLAGELMVLS